jgi:hypothetical protein
VPCPESSAGRHAEPRKARGRLTSPFPVTAARGDGNRAHHLAFALLTLLYSTDRCTDSPNLCDCRLPADPPARFRPGTCIWSIQAFPGTKYHREWVGGRPSREPSRG